MNTLQALLNTWKLVGFYYIFAVLSLIVAFHFLGRNIAIAIFCLEVFLHGRWWIDLKSKFLKSLRDDYEYIPAYLEEDCSPIDVKTLCEYTQNLESLGFVKIKDFKLSPESGGNRFDFSRLFSHPQHDCFAELLQACPQGRDPMPVGCSISSFLDEDWSLASTQIKPNGISHIWRNCKGLWTYHPAAMVPELLTIHLERRKQIEEDLKLKILTDLSWNTYLEKERQRSMQRQQNLQQKNIIIALLEATFFELKLPSEWMGNYRKVAGQKRMANL